MYTHMQVPGAHEYVYGYMAEELCRCDQVEDFEIDHPGYLGALHHHEGP